ALEHSLRYPVLTISSGPANSIRGAAYLTGARNALVADIGGTSTDVGVLANGFPRESTTPAEIGGVRTNFRMPDLVAVALGGGSVLVPNRLRGVSEVQRPEHFDVANAIGAAIASVSGQVDRIFHPGPGGRRAALDEACEEARVRAVSAGADPGRIEIVD